MHKQKNLSRMFRRGEEQDTRNGIFICSSPSWDFRQEGALSPMNAVSPGGPWSWSSNCKFSSRLVHLILSHCRLSLQLGWSTMGGTGYMKWVLLPLISLLWDFRSVDGLSFVTAVSSESSRLFLRITKNYFHVEQVLCRSSLRGIILQCEKDKRAKSIEISLPENFDKGIHLLSSPSFH